MKTQGRKKRALSALGAGGRPMHRRKAAHADEGCRANPVVVGEGTAVHLALLELLSHVRAPRLGRRSHETILATREATPILACEHCR